MKRSLLIACCAAGLMQFVVGPTAFACSAQACVAQQTQFVAAPVVQLQSFDVPVATPTIAVPTVAVAASAEIATTPVVVTAPIVAPVFTTPIVTPPILTAPVVTAPAVVIENAHLAKPKMAPRRVRLHIFAR